MSSKNARVAKPPKRAYTGPSMIAVALFILILLVLTPNTVAFYTNKASIQALVLIFLSPLIIPELFCAYHTGLAVGKIARAKQHKELFAPFLALAVMQAICIALCVGIEIGIAGYPIELCFDWCQKVRIIDVVVSYLQFSTVLFLPAYYAAWRYHSWHKKSHKKSK